MRSFFGPIVLLLGFVGAFNCSSQSKPLAYVPGGDEQSHEGDPNQPGSEDGSTSGVVDAAPPDLDSGRLLAAGNIATSNVEIVVEPTDNGSRLKSAIANAKASIRMAMYLLTARDVIDSLIAQKKQGRTVEVLLNKNFPTDSNGNQTAFNKLQQAGVNVRWAPDGFSFSHQKCVLIDDVEAWIMTMNVTGTSARDNREYLAVDRDPADVRELRDIFKADFENLAYHEATRLVVAPINARERLVGLIDAADHSVLIEAESLGDRAITDALNRAADRGASVRLVHSPGDSSSSELEALTSLKDHGIKVVALQEPYIHAKMIVVDGAIAYVGSENFTFFSLQNNREVGLFLSIPSEVAKITSTAEGDFARGTAQ